MTTQLLIYNNALLELGERKLASLTESREPARVLQDIWDDGFVDTVLSAGLWKFAKKSVEIAYDTSFTQQFGYNYAFTKPSDFIRTAAVCVDEYFEQPLLQYGDEVSYWFADITPLYVQYISNDTSYGGNLTEWPEKFARYAESYLALRACKRLTSSKTDADDLKKQTKTLLLDAKSTDAMADPTKFMPSGTWSSARLGAAAGPRVGTTIGS